ncbi:helix-turn-helix domain-containing protein [Sporosarcina sp. Sa2YVA2]|uniref:Helix-turn-helix domain-containing protein n=1 Tax=Sporosarcina quadrami TaxID=2762234 RepID=A0ABR8U8N3_9BACL|nr:helix-turn-helix domain-containing protein [Sporosarcina quadrami]MBD7984391.1 helix-turn-helix domain-containing protein [Sporosarcina quadrami]
MSTMLNTETTYISLQPFSSVDELNANTIAIRAQYRDQLTPSTIAVLDVLHRYSCKYPGVCYLSKSKIAEMVGVTRRTVVRACNALESLGIIVQHELFRHKGDKRQSSNAIVFVVVEKENVTPECHSKEALSDTHLNSSNTLDTRKADFDKKEVVKNVEEVKADIKRGLRDKMPAYIYDLLSPYFDLDDLYQAYGTLLRGKASIDKSIMFESNERLYSDAVLSVIHAYKRGVVRNLFAVLFTAAQDTTAQIYRNENYNAPNWLEW